MKIHFHLIALLCAVAWTAGCGAPGAPLPPSLELARPVRDLTATRKGNKVFLGWSVPTQTTDGQNVRASKIGPAQVCRGITSSPMTSCAQVAGEIPAEHIPLTKPGEQPQKLAFTDVLNEQVEREHPAQFATYAVSMLNWRGRTAGLSNQVKVPLAPVLPPPADVKAAVTKDGVELRFSRSDWFSNTNVTRGLRFYRRTEGTNAHMLIAEVLSPATENLYADQNAPMFEFTDRTFEWEKTYYYHITPVTIVTENGKKIAEVEGDDSPEVKVFARDIFPPAQPTGLQAVYSGPGQKPFIDLIWAPSTEADLAGYDVYRHEQGQAAAKINSALVRTSSFRDDNVQPGHAYFYSVSAVDLRGNQSPRSEETSETVP